MKASTRITITGLAGTAAALVLATGLLAQGGPYASVKAFVGSVTLQAQRESSDRTYSFKETLQAEGPVEIRDAMMPDGGHFTWPMIKPNDPASGGTGWRATVRYSSTKTEAGNGAAMPGTSVTCSATEEAQWGVVLAAPPGLGKYVLALSPRGLKAVACKGSEQGQTVNKTEPLSVLDEMKLEGKAPGPIGGGQTLTVKDWKVTVKYSLSPTTR